jgi:hypothetical protein
VSFAAVSFHGGFLGFGAVWVWEGSTVSGFLHLSCELRGTLGWLLLVGVYYVLCNSRPRDIQ